ncbi:MAG: hypothetical protein ABF752_01175 [Acetobacter fabarum]|uniref:hypothetical protein n=1 Tax=Acetobacter fabarum TaxID=483199 RepID=UPI0039E874D1
MPNFAPPQPATEPARPLWRNSFMHRLMLATLISQMENRLLAENSATQTLEHWLREHALLGAHETLRAEREAGAHSPCPPDLLAALDLPTTQGGQSLRYRKIRLAGHNRIYSEAENWFVPERLTKAMTEALEQTDTPFGRVVSPLRFTRQLIRRETLWSPLPDLWEMQPHPPNSTTGADPLALPPHLFRHIALLRTHAGTPFSLVVETYTPQAFAFTPPPAR